MNINSVMVTWIPSSAMCDNKFNMLIPVDVMPFSKSRTNEDEKPINYHHLGFVNSQT